MDKAQMINLFVGKNAENFDSSTLVMIKKDLENCDEFTLNLLISTSFKSPSTILIIAIFPGCDRFFLDDIGMGLLKVFTGWGAIVWWVLDIISAKRRTQEYNFKQFQKIMMFNK